MAPEPKSERFEMRMDEETRDQLRDLADDAKESEASVIRALIRAAHAKRRVKSR